MSVLYVIPELRSGDADWPLFHRLLGYAAASGIMELQSALAGMRAAGLVVETRADGYRIGARVPAVGGYETMEAWQTDRERWLRPYSVQLAAWLAVLWQEDHTGGKTDV